MKVLTKNVKLYFECDTDLSDCPAPQKEESDPHELTISGVPICQRCGSEMVLDPECLITN
jgi:hypothetical protein